MKKKVKMIILLERLISKLLRNIFIIKESFQYLFLKNIGKRRRKHQMF